MTSNIDTTLTRFPPAAADFARNLYIEHIEEVAFLYEQRNYMLNNPGFAARDIAWNEVRTDRHVDALAAGGDPALRICVQRSNSGERGELYAAMRVFCSIDLPHLVKSTLDSLDVEDNDSMSAARDALKHGLPQLWSPRVSKWLDEADEARAALLAIVCAYRELSLGPVIARKASGPLSNPVPFLWALGRLRERGATSLFRHYLEAGENESPQAAAVAALRCGDPGTASLLRAAAARAKPWASVPLALIGNQADFETLRHIGHTNGPDARLALAMGLLGNSEAIDTLLRWLELGDIAEAARLALHLITGAYPTGARGAGRSSTNNVEASDGPDEVLSRDLLAQTPETREFFHSQIRKDVNRDLPVHSATVLYRGLAEPRLPRGVRDLVGDALMIRHQLHTAPCDSWGRSCNPVSDSSWLKS